MLLMDCSGEFFYFFYFFEEIRGSLSADFVLIWKNFRFSLTYIIMSKFNCIFCFIWENFSFFFCLTCMICII